MTCTDNKEIKPCDNCLKINLIDGPKSLIGKCGCDCIYQIEVGKHPWNKGVFKGSVSDRLGWVCTALIEDGSKAMFLDRSNCICEMYTEEVEIQSPIEGIRDWAKGWQDSLDGKGGFYKQYITLILRSLSQFLETLEKGCTGDR